MNDEEAEWGSELDEYIDAYVEDELEDDDPEAALAAYQRFEQEERSAVVVASGPSRGVVIAGIAAALAAGVAGLWLWSGQRLDASSSQLPSGGLAQDVVDTDGNDGIANAVDPPPQRTQRTSRPEPAPLVEPTPEPEAPEVEALSPEPAPADKRRPKVKRAAPQEPVEPPVSRLSEELEALRALRKAARQGKYARALELAKEHRAGFDKPSLAAERDLIELEALCGLNRISEARRSKAKFLERHASHHLRVKAEEMCGKKLGPAQKNDSPGHPPQ